MDILRAIDTYLETHDTIRTADVVARTGVTRQYASRMLSRLVRGGILKKVGATKAAVYSRAAKYFSHVYANKNLAEDEVYEEVAQACVTSIELRPNITHMFEYMFTEIFNNAIDHSRSKRIMVRAQGALSSLNFTIEDHGIGIFNNIASKKKLPNELEAALELTKGKLTTDPKRHTGEGIFFTSKIADRLIISSGTTRLTVDNTIPDIFIDTIADMRGTAVDVTLARATKRTLARVFGEYTDENYRFSKTKVVVKLYKIGTSHISRSQARRILNRLDKFDTITFDFNNVEAVGQAFADEIFRVFQRKYPRKKLVPVHVNKSVMLMIKHAQSQKAH